MQHLKLASLSGEVLLVDCSAGSVEKSLRTRKNREKCEIFENVGQFSIIWKMSEIMSENKRDRAFEQQEKTEDTMNGDEENV